MDCPEGSDDEGKEEVKSKESSQGGVIYGKPSSHSIYDLMPDVGDSPEQVSNYSGPPEAHLTSGENISQESSSHGQEEDGTTYCSHVRVIV